jgi:SSS family solute:Na+ symporter
MIFSRLDLVILFGFFAAVLLIGFITSRKNQSDEEYLLAGRKVGLFLFVLTNVATWYGGILGVGEFTYRYGLVNWFTQGFPYYLFAILFAVFFVKKVKSSSNFTIPERMEQMYGKKISLLSAVSVFVLASPAPYLLMVGIIISHIFNISLFLSLVIALVLTATYPLIGGYKSDIITDALFFFIMFIGFIVAAVFLLSHYGVGFLSTHLPPEHLSLTGGVGKEYIIVWWLIALWTFVDPGFFQRTQAARTPKVATYGILISVAFWLLFDALTNTVGLYARALFPNLATPSQSYLILADNVLFSGMRGLFYAGMIASILSTLNSFLFISATTLANDFMVKIPRLVGKYTLKKLTITGIIIASALSLILAVSIPSVIDLWYTIGSLVIPGLLFLLVSVYFPKWMVAPKIALIEIISGFGISTAWFILRDHGFIHGGLEVIEPMVAGLIVVSIIHGTGLFLARRKSGE